MVNEGNISSKVNITSCLNSGVPPRPWWDEMKYVILILAGIRVKKVENMKFEEMDFKDIILNLCSNVEIWFLGSC